MGFNQTLLVSSNLPNFNPPRLERERQWPCGSLIVCQMITRTLCTWEPRYWTRVNIKYLVWFLTSRKWLLDFCSLKLDLFLLETKLKKNRKNTYKMRPTSETTSSINSPAYYLESNYSATPPTWFRLPSSPKFDFSIILF